MISPILPTYPPRDLAFTSGEGAYLVTDDGTRYLDFTSGIGVTCLGHAHPHLVDILRTQADRLWHCSNMFHIPEQERLARRLVDASFADSVFFCNSGAEAVEAGIKTVRRYFHARGESHRHRLICANNGFHGRTFAAIAASGQVKMLEGFGPPLTGFDHVPFGDLEAVRAAIIEETAAILVEPVQGEGGINIGKKDYIRGLRTLADDHDILLFFDEVQCGMGRTGRLFAHEWSGVQPDVMALAKGIGGGFPIGAMLATAACAGGMTPGSHGSTYGGNPLAMAVANGVLDILLQESFLDRVRETGFFLRRGLRDVARDHPTLITDVRGLGLMTGLACAGDHTKMIQALRAEKLLTVRAGNNVVRMLPPLIIDRSHAEAAIAAVKAACLSLQGPAPKESVS